MKKKLLISTDSFLPRRDGTAIFIGHLIPFLAKKFDITIISPKFEGDLPECKATVIQFPLKSKISDIEVAGFNIKKIKEIAAQHDLILNHTLGPIGVSTIKAAKKLKKPIAIFVHSLNWELYSYSFNKIKFLIKWLTKKWVRHWYKAMNIIIYPSKRAKEEFEKVGVRIKSKIIEVKIPLKKFKPKRTKHKDITIGFCGRIGHEKGVDNLLKVYRKLKKRHSNLKLLLVGTGIKSIMKKARKIGAKVTGEVIDPENYYPQMNMIVLPSLTETTSLVAMEAMACGIPLITSDVGRFPEFVKNSKSGILVEPENEEQLEHAIELMLLEKSLRTECAKNARAYAVKHFDIKSSANKIIKVLNSL